MSDYVDKAQAWDLMAERAAKIKKLEAEIERLRQDRDSWRGVAEQLEHEKQAALAGGEAKRHYTRADYDAAPEDGAGREPPARP